MLFYNLPAIPVSGGTLFACFLLAGDVSGTTGDVMTFTLTRVGDINEDGHFDGGDIDAFFLAVGGHGCRHWPEP